MLLTSVATYAEEPFKMEGKPILTVFTNYKTSLNAENDISGFNLDRAFIGYGVTLPEGFSAKGVVNVETLNVNGKMEFNTYLKNIQIDWRNDDFFVSMGLINLMQFSEQERVWGHRYIFKSFQEQYGYTFCEDIGVLVGYNISDALSIDVAITNGEGRKFANQNNKNRYGIGATYKPIEGLTLRGYFDYYQDMLSLTESQDQISYALFAGYEHEKFSVGAEYNKSYNFQFAENIDMSGYSFYSTVPLYKKLDIYGRYDLLKPNKIQNSAFDGDAIIVGVDYAPTTFFRLSPNFQSMKIGNQKRANYILMSLELKI